MPCARRPMLVNIYMKFHEDFLNGLQVTEWTRFCDGQTDVRLHGQTDRRPLQNNMSPNSKGGRHNKRSKHIQPHLLRPIWAQLENLQFLKINRYKFRFKTTASAMKGQSADQPPPLKKKSFFFALSPRTKILKRELSRRKLREISRKFAQTIFFSA